MTLAALYPFWPDTHEELRERVAVMGGDTLNFKPSAGTSSIRQLVLLHLHFEREWIAGIVAGYLIETPRASSLQTGGALAEAMAAQRLLTARVLEPLTEAGLRAVRTVPADMVPGRPEANHSIGWMFWCLLERDLALYGQVQLRMEEERAVRRAADR